MEQATTKKIRFSRPVILGPNASKTALGMSDPWMKMVIVGLVRDKPLRVRNAGQTALVWALRCGYDPIELWGFDSLVDGKRTTDSDQFWPRKDLPNAPPAWNNSWYSVFQVYKDLVLPVHVYEGSRLKMGDMNRHFRLIHHPRPEPEKK